MGALAARRTTGPAHERRYDVTTAYRYVTAHERTNDRNIRTMKTKIKKGGG